MPHGVWFASFVAFLTDPLLELCIILGINKNVMQCIPLASNKYWVQALYKNSACDLNKEVKK